MVNTIISNERNKATGCTVENTVTMTFLMTRHKDGVSRVASSEWLHQADHRGSSDGLTARSLSQPGTAKPRAAYT